jgi:hypothetical protein
MTHLSSDELVDAIEETLTVERLAHLTACDACAEQLAQLRGVLADVGGVEVSEPSPLFWEQLSVSVRRAIAEEAASSPRQWRWFNWPVLVPVGALGALVLALVSAVPQGADRLLQVQLAMSGATETLDADMPADADAHWDLMAALIGDLDFDGEEPTGMNAMPGTADQAVLQLSSAEQQELVRLLREELDRSGG